MPLRPPEPAPSQPAAPPPERSETLAMVWPVGAAPPALPAPPHVADLRVRRARDRAAFSAVQAAAGWTVTGAQWQRLLDEVVPGSMTLAWSSGQPVAACCALRRPAGWVELAWVAVIPAQRGRGLGLRVCAALTRSLLSMGHTRLHGSTQDSRLAALRIYLDLGFHPLYRPAKVARWRAVCAHLERRFSPEAWGWPGG